MCRGPCACRAGATAGASQRPHMRSERRYRAALSGGTEYSWRQIILATILAAAAGKATGCAEDPVPCRGLGSELSTRRPSRYYTSGHPASLAVVTRGSDRPSQEARRGSAGLPARSPFAGPLPGRSALRRAESVLRRSASACPRIAARARLAAGPVAPPGPAATRPRRVGAGRPIRAWFRHRYRPAALGWPGRLSGKADEHDSTASNVAPPRWRRRAQAAG